MVAQNAPAEISPRVRIWGATIVAAVITAAWVATGNHHTTGGLASISGYAAGSSLFASLVVWAVVYLVFLRGHIGKARVASYWRFVYSVGFITNMALGGLNPYQADQAVASITNTITMAQQQINREDHGVAASPSPPAQGVGAHTGISFRLPWAKADDTHKITVPAAQTATP